MDIFSQASHTGLICCDLLCAGLGLAMSSHMKTLLAIVSLAVCATPVARAYEVFDPSVGYEAPPLRRVPDAVIPKGYDYSTPPSQLINQPTQTSCVQTTYGYRCFSL